MDHHNDPPSGSRATENASLHGESQSKVTNIVIAILAVIAVTAAVLSFIALNKDDASQAREGVKVETTDGGTTDVQIIDTAVGTLKVPLVAERCEFNAYEAATGSYEFGKSLQPFVTASEALNVFAGDMAKDCLFAATWVAMERQHLTGETFSGEGVAELAEEFRYNRQAWQRAINGFFERNPNVRLLDMSGVAYESLGMKPGANRQQMPQLTLMSQHQDMGQVLEFRTVAKESWPGNTSRIACRNQPGMPKAPLVPRVSPPRPAPPVQAPPPVAPPPVAPPPWRPPVGPPPVFPPPPPPPPVCDWCGCPGVPCPPPPCEVTGDCKGPSPVIPGVPPADWDIPEPVPTVPQVPFDPTRPNSTPGAPSYNTNPAAPDGVTALPPDQSPSGQPVEQQAPDVNRPVENPAANTPVNGAPTGGVVGEAGSSDPDA